MSSIAKDIFLKIKRANLAYHLVADDDRIAVGLSGGKDSLVLLHALTLLRKYTPLQFEFMAITIDLGQGADYLPLEDYCTSCGIPMVRERTNIGRLVFEDRQEKNPCALCAHLRRGALHRVAGKYGCNKVALAHHLDDAVVTLFMAGAFEGQFRTFAPATYLDRTGLTIIRPLVYVPQKSIIKLARQLNLPVVANPCPAAGKTKRHTIEKWLEALEENHPLAKRRFLTALEKSFWHPSAGPTNTF